VPFFPDLEGKIVDNEDLLQEAIAVLFDLEAHLVIGQSAHKTPPPDQK
jgi:hypothetical protein